MPQTVDRHWAWFVLLGTFLSNLIAGGVLFSFGILYTDFLDRLEVPVVQTAVTGAIGLACCCFSAPFSSAMTCKLGYRIVTVLGGSLGFLGLLLCCFAPTIHYSYVFFGILVGSGFGLVFVASFTALEDYFDGLKNISHTFASCGLPTGIFILPLISRALLETYSYFGTYLILSALMLNVIVCGLLFKPLIKNAIIKRDKGTYKQMINPVENEQERSYESSPFDQGQGQPSDVEPQKEAKISPAEDEKQKLKAPKSPKYKAIEMPEETKVVPLTSTTLRFDDFAVDDEIENNGGDDEEESPVDDENDSKPEETIKKTADGAKPGEGMGRSNISEPDRVVGESQESGKALLNVIVGLYNARMLCNWRAILYLLASVLFATGFGIPVVFYPDVSRHFGYSDNLAEWTLSLIGLGSCAGVVLGNFCRLKLSKTTDVAAAIVVITVSCFLCGILTGLVHYYTGYRILLLSAFLYGVFSNPFLSMRRHIIEEIVHETFYKEVYCFGVWLSGFGYLIGIPVAGWLKGDTYTWSYVFASISIGICGLLLCPLIFFKKAGSS